MSGFVFDKFAGGGGPGDDDMYWDFSRPGKYGEWWLSFHAIPRSFMAWNGVSSAPAHTAAMLAVLPEEEKARAMALAVKHRGDHGI